MMGYIIQSYRPSDGKSLGYARSDITHFEIGGWTNDFRLAAILHNPAIFETLKIKYHSYTDLDIIKHQMRDIEKVYEDICNI